MVALTTNHIAIQTSDLDNSVRWYQACFGAEQAWELSRFSETTRSRLPGIRKLVELRSGGVVFHLFERPVEQARPDAEQPSFQHFCVEVASERELHAVRQRWLKLYRQGGCRFASHELPTEVEWDGDASASFYMLDPNGLEYEVTYVAAP